MSLGVPVISTSIGAEGIPVTDRKNILIADTPAAFADAVSFCIRYPEECRRIGERAADFVRQNYNEEVIAGRLMEFLIKLKS